MSKKNHWAVSQKLWLPLSSFWSSYTFRNTGIKTSTPENLKFCNSFFWHYNYTNPFTFIFYEFVYLNRWRLLKKRHIFTMYFCSFWIKRLACWHSHASNVKACFIICCLVCCRNLFPSVTYSRAVKNKWQRSPVGYC